MIFRAIYRDGVSKKKEVTFEAADLGAAINIVATTQEVPAGASAVRVFPYRSIHEIFGARRNVKNPQA